MARSTNYEGPHYTIFQPPLYLFFLRMGWDQVPWHLGHKLTIVPVPGDTWDKWSILWNENWQRILKYLVKTCPSATLPTKNPTWIDLGLKSWLTNHLSYGIQIFSLAPCSHIPLIFVRTEVLTAVAMKNSIFRYVLIEVNWHFGL